MNRRGTFFGDAFARVAFAERDLSWSVGLGHPSTGSLLIRATKKRLVNL